MTDNKFPPFEEMRREIYRLFTLAFARQPATDTYVAVVGAHSPEFSEMIDRLEAEFESTLLRLAVLIRAHDDRFGWSRAAKEAAHKLGSEPDGYAICGTLVENGKRRGLDLRDACNRIIHSAWTYVDYENVTTKSEQHGKEPQPGEELLLYPTIVLKQSPQLSKDPWRADIDVLRLIYFASQLSIEDEDWFFPD